MAPSIIRLVYFIICLELGGAADIRKRREGAASCGPDGSRPAARFRSARWWSRSAIRFSGSPWSVSTSFMAVPSPRQRSRPFSADRLRNPCVGFATDSAVEHGRQNRPTATPPGYARSFCTGGRRPDPPDSVDKPPCSALGGSCGYAVAEAGCSGNCWPACPNRPAQLMGKTPYLCPPAAPPASGNRSHHRPHLCGVVGADCTSAPSAGS